MWGPYECFSSAELGDAQFYAYFFSYRRTEALMRETTSGYCWKLSNNGFSGARKLRKFSLAVLRTHVNWGTINATAD